MTAGFTLKLSVAFPVPSPTMLILSHRGFHAHHPENTLAAFAAAIDLGVDGIETDVRLSRDQQLILYHDRLSPAGQAVATLTRAELSNQVGYEVPTLTEALQLVSLGQQFLWNLELKTPDVLPPLREILDQIASARKILVTSFWHPLIAALASQMEIDLGLLVAHYPLISAGAMPWTWLADYPSVRTIVYHYNTLDAALVTQTRAWGLRVLVYGAITAQDQQQLQQWGVEGVITDHPASWLP